MRFVKTRRRWIAAFIGMLLCCLLAGCNASASSLPSQPTSTSAAPMPISRGTIDHLVATSGCGHAATVAPGTSADQSLAVNPAEALGHATRSYRVHIPVGYQNTISTPLLLYFHGHGGTAAGADQGSGFSAFADQQHFIVAYGQGALQGNGGPPFWADVGPIDFGVDDLHYVSLLLDDLQSKYCIDAHRIFATGFSNGGGMSTYLACRMAGRIAAFAPVSGDHYVAGGCQPGRPVPLLDIHGSADPVEPYMGVSDPSWPLISVPQQLQEWAVCDGVEIHSGAQVAFPQLFALKA